MFKALLLDESGVILSAELILILTLGVLAMVVGLSEVAIAVNTELNDISNAIGAFNQSYATTSYRNFSRKFLYFIPGTTFYDVVDDCDWNMSCDIVCSGPLFSWGG